MASQSEDMWFLLEERVDKQEREGRWERAVPPLVSSSYPMDSTSKFGDLNFVVGTLPECGALTEASANSAASLSQNFFSFPCNVNNKGYTCKHA